MAERESKAERKVARPVLVGAALAILLGAVVIWPGSGAFTYDAGQVFTPCLEVTPGKEHWGKPGCRGESRMGPRRAEMAFNSRGIRDREYPSFPGKGTVRILVLSSSNTLGPGIAENATFPRQLEQMLRSRGRRVEVINAGMVGYCPSQMALRAGDMLEAYHPNFVLLQFVQGACPLFDGAWAGRIRYEAGHPIALDRNPVSPTGSWAFVNDFLFRHPSLFFLWLSATDQARKVRFSQRYSLFPREEDRYTSYLRPSRRFLQGIMEQAKATGAGFATLSYRMRPFMQSVPSQMNPFIARMASPFIAPPGATGPEILEVLLRNGIPVIYDDSPTEPFLVPGETHLNEQGLRNLASFAASRLDTLVFPKK